MESVDRQIAEPYLKIFTKKQIFEKNNISPKIEMNGRVIQKIIFSRDQIKAKISKVIILEYNSIFGHEKELVVPNLKNFDRTKAHYSNLYYGGSLKSYVSLMAKKGYYFLGVNRLRNNAFFINNDFSKNKYFENIDIMSLAESTNSNFSESRDEKGNLNYLKNEEKLKAISDCDVVNLQIDKTSLHKIKDII